MRKRSFALTEEGYSKLGDIKELKNHETLAESARFCIDFTFERLLFTGEPAASDEVKTLVQKNNILLRYILIEIVRNHGGKAKPLDESVRHYLKQLHEQIKSYMESHAIEVQG